MTIQNSPFVNNNWDLIDLRVFCQVARRASFVGAATDLGISPAYVTKRIAGLEKALGIRLFNRTTRRVLISDAGEAAYGWARRVLEAADALDAGVTGFGAAPSGQLRISTSLRLGRDHIAPILSQLNEQYPALDVWLELLDRRVDLLGEDFDIDVRIGEVNEPRLVAHPVARGYRVLCAAPAYLARRPAPQSLGELAGHECLLFRERHQAFGTWRLQGPQGEESVKVTGAMASNHSDVAVGWALEGRGIVLLAGWDVADSLRTGRLVRVLPDYNQSADVWAVTAARLDSSAKLRVCTRFIVEKLRQGPHALDTTLR